MTTASTDPSNDPNITWKEVTSTNGNKYSVGYSDGAPVDIESAETVFAKGKSVGCQVNWEYTESSDWINTLSSVSSRTAITKYCLTKGTLYDYTLWIYCTDTYNYLFADESGDVYALDTFTTGTHYVSFNSPSPTILFVSCT